MSLSMRPFVMVDEFRVKDPLPPAKRDRWLRKLSRQLVGRIEKKFILGQLQYKCDFGEQTVGYLLDQIEQEAIDQLMYVAELRRRMVMEKNNQSKLQLQEKK